MKHYEDVIIPQRTDKVCVKTTCDVCKNIIPREGMYERRETTVKHLEGSSYPECGSYESLSFDLCKECWNTKLVPFLNSLGAEGTTEEVNW